MKHGRNGFDGRRFVMLQLPKQEIHWRKKQFHLLSTHFSLERFLCLDLWGQFLFVALVTDAEVLSLASKRLVVDVDASIAAAPALDCSLGDG